MSKKEEDVRLLNVLMAIKSIIAGSDNSDTATNLILVLIKGWQEKLEG
jgi:hypothetical protein